jgi:hypothetical protein
MTTDLAWLETLVSSLATGTFTLERTIALLGDDVGADDMRSGARLVRPRLPALSSASVYPLPHIKTPVAMDLVFAKGAQPELADLAARFGEPTSVPRAPGDFTSGDKHACYVTRDKTTVRIFAELDQGRVAKLFIDAYTGA